MHDDDEADSILRKMRFDGRSENIHPKDDEFIRGFHCYLSPNVAAQALWALSVLPEHNADLPNDDYPDLSQNTAFK